MTFENPRFDGLAGPATGADGVTRHELLKRTAVALVGVSSLRLLDVVPALAANRAAGVLTVAQTADVDVIDPHRATAFHTQYVLEQIYGTLVEFDSKLDIAPGLASDWTFSKDLKTLKLKLRNDVHFHNGQQFTSNDVRASLVRILQPKTGAVGRSNLLLIHRIKTPDKYTVVLVLRQPNDAILAALATLYASMLSASDIASGAFLKKPNGTGPFRFSSWTTGQSFNLVRNASYWGGKPPLAGVDFRVVPDETSIVAALQTGNVQLGVVTDPVVARQIHGLNVLRTPSLSYHALMLNDRRPPLNDKRVRLAIQAAVDRNQVLASAALGEGIVVGPITSPAYRSLPNDRPYPKPNIAAAKNLLAQAGHSGGITLKTIVATGLYSTAVNEAQSLQAQLKQAGINLDLQVQEASTYVKSWLADDFDAAVALNGSSPDPDTTYTPYFTSTGSLKAQGGLSSPKLDQLFAQGRQTADVPTRRKVYKEISEYLEDNAAWIWMFSSYDYRVLASSVRNFKPMPNGSLKYLRQTSLA